MYVMYVKLYLNTLASDNYNYTVGFHCNLFKNTFQQTGQSVIQLGFMPMSIELMKAINSTLRTLPQIDMINRFPTQPYRRRYEFLDWLKFAVLLQSVGMNSDHSGGSSVSQNKLPQAQLILGYIYILKYLQSNWLDLLITHWLYFILLKFILNLKLSCYNLF